MSVLVRKLQIGDYEKGFNDLVKKFYTENNDNENLEGEYYETFLNTFHDIEKNPNHTIFVLYDYEYGTIMGYISLVIEPKFLYLLKKEFVARIEDLTILDYAIYSENMSNYASLLIEKCMEVCRDNGCHKVTMSSNKLTKKCYEHFGFEKQKKSYSVFL